MDDSALHTVTHARLRALQGDSAGAVMILEAVLARRPGDLEARELLAELPRGAGPPPEIDEVAVAPPKAASAAELAHRFRRKLGRRSASRRRLERFLTLVTRRAR